jgi:hypothetical protein
MAALFATIGTAPGAAAQPPNSSTEQPAIRDVKVRPFNEQTDVAPPRVPYLGKSLPDVKRVRTTHEPSSTQSASPPAPHGERQWHTPDAKPVRTTREHATGEPVPAVRSLRPPEIQQ